MSRSALSVLKMIGLKFINAFADNPVIMNTKLLFLGAALFSVLASKTDDMLFAFLAVYLTALAIPVFFFKHEQKGKNSLLPETSLPDK